MPEFTDATGQRWDVSLDGLTLAELREKAGIDIVQDGLYLAEQREDVLTKVLLILCREQREDRKLSDRQFARIISGSVADSAIEAIRSAASFFFRPSRWLEIQSRSATRKEMDGQYQALRPMLELLNRPDMPPTMREAVMAAISEKIEAATASQTSATGQSVSGLATIPSNVAGDLLDSLASTPGA